MDEKTTINIDHDPQTRKGVFADITMARTDGGVTRLDFIQTDLPIPDGDIQAVLAARVFLRNESIVALRDMLNDHLKTAGIEKADE